MDDGWNKGNDPREGQNIQYRRFVKRGRKAEDYQSLREITLRCKLRLKMLKMFFTPNLPIR